MEGFGRHRPVPLGHEDVRGRPLFALQTIGGAAAAQTAPRPSLTVTTIFLRQYFRPSRRTILALVHSISPQRVDGYDQVCDRGALLAHSRSARRHGRYT